MKHLFSALLTIVLGCYAAFAAGSPQPASESQKVPAMMWVDAEGNLKTMNSEDSIVKYVNLLADLGFTHIVVDARPITGEVLYDSKIAPRFKGKRDDIQPAEGLDYLGTFIREGHKRGMKILFSLNVFCAGHNYHDHGLIYSEHPEWASIVQDPVRGLVPITEQKEKYGAMVNPVNDEYQQYIIDVMKEMTQVYPDVDGLMLDRGRYDGICADFSDLSRRKFEEFIGQEIENFPADILTITRENGVDKVTPGKHYKDWIFWRSKTIHDFFQRARQEVKGDNEDLIFATYSGAWYPSYYEVGVNFASKDYDVARDFPKWAREDYKDTGYAELLDLYVTGNYYTDITIADYENNPDPIWNETDFEGHTGDWYCVEGSCNHLREILGPNKFWGGLLVDQLYGEIERLPEAMEMNARMSDGLMMFDIVHIISRDLWDLVREGMMRIGNIPRSRTASMDVIPAPQQADFNSDKAPFELGAATLVVAGSQLQNEARLFTDMMQRLTGIHLDITAQKPRHANYINLVIDKKIKSDEGYRINVEPSRITVSGRTPAGVFYGAMQLAKAIGAGTALTIQVPQGQMSGAPQYAYRGAHFDVCRHFYDVDRVKSFIDMMALHGLNQFHWHLSDDQGWRIEIKKYPLLTTLGSHRDSTVIGRNSGVWDHTPVDGYFTQDQAREIVEYAAQRHINVIPEIDLPGHMRAALHAYPYLGCTGGPYSVWTEWGVDEDVLCPGEPRTMQFVTDVLNEIMDIFPSPIIHAGGDECPKTRWHECPKCQALIQQLGIEPLNGLSAEDRLQGVFTQLAYDVCHKRGRRLIGWDEILQGDIPSDAIVMIWQGMRALPEAMRRGHDVVFAPNEYFYFDFYQTKDTEQEPFAIGGFVPVEKVYSFDPTNAPQADPAHFLGVQANLWTEYIKDFDHVQYMELPRMAALSEVQWNAPDTRDFNQFRSRIPAMLSIYDRLGYNYARHIADVSATYTPNPADNTLRLTLESLPDAQIRYTLDGSDPTETSQLYTNPLSISHDADIRYASFRPGTPRGRILADSFRFNKATCQNIALQSTPAPGYAFTGAPILNDGLTGTYNYRTGRWLGFNQEPLRAVITFDNPTEVSQFGMNIAVFSCDGVVDAASATLEASDDGGNTYRVVKQWVNDPIDPADEFTVKNHIITLDNPVTATTYRITVEPQPALPAWHPLSGARAFVFIDELLLN